MALLPLAARLVRLFAVTLAAGVLAACGGGMKLEDFRDAQPTFDVQQYFAGRQVLAHGLFEDRFGKVRRQFRVVITGNMDGDVLVLDEDFTYDDGEKDRRVWRITRTGPDTYEGTAGDVIGVARGKVAGNALNWTYDLDLKVGDDVWRVKFDDWMLLQADDVLLNRAWVYRWGFEIGSITLSFAPMGKSAAE